jgi:hypothetical protein
MQCACAILSSMVYPALHNISGIFSKRRAFLKKCLTYSVCFDFLYKVFPETFFLFQEELSEMWSKCILTFMSSIRYFCPILMKLGFFRQIIEKYWNIKFHENSSNKSWVAACGWSGKWADGRTDRRSERRTDRRTERRTDRRTAEVTKLIVALPKFSNEPKNLRERIS